MTALKVAVTGASGFIGRHVLAELALHPVAITAVTRNAAKLANSGSGVRVVEMDIARPGPADYARLEKPDVLMHLAWGGLPNYNALHHFETELPQQYRFLKGLVEAGLPAMVVAGTCFEYGMQSGALSEELPALPDNPYGYAKDALRRQLEFLRGTHAFALTWARLFYMYGAGQAATALYPQLKSAVERGDKVFNMSGGKQLRDYLPVTAVAAALVALAIRKTDSGVVNICSGTPITVRDLVEGWIRENGWSIQINLGHYPYPDHEPMAFWGDNAKYTAI
ncbi:MAG: NAD-dependent epimerase/dehydratase family protein [Planctomycetota bacterium]